MRNCLFGACLLLLLACAGTAPQSVTNKPPPGDAEWPTATLAERGFDSVGMQRLGERLDAGDFPNTHMVLVEHDGWLVYEKYLSGEDQAWGVDIGYREFDADSLHDLRSVTKSVTSLLLGIALGGDYQAALSRPVIEYFPEFAGRVPPGAEAITLHQVLTMTSGQQWNEMDIPYSSQSNDEIRLYNTADPIEYVLGKPITRKPGQDWYYSGGSTMLLAEIVVRVSGMEFIEFARQALFDPLGIRARDVEWRGLGIWYTRPRLPSAASGLRLRGRDLAKIGSLMLHDGRWRGRQVVPAEWVRLSSRRHTEQTYPIWNHGGIYGYGYQWWHGQFREPGQGFVSVTAVGYGGQRVFVIGENRLVVTIFGANYDTGLYNVSERVLAEIVAAAPP